VERVALLDDQTARRSVSVDFLLPDSYVQHNTSNAMPVLAPIAMLRKRPLVAFDLRDEAGNALPLLTSDANGKIASEMLVLTAAINLQVRHGRRLPDSLRRELEQLPYCSDADAESAL